MKPPAAPRLRREASSTDYPVTTGAGSQDVETNALEIADRYVQDKLADVSGGDRTAGQKAKI